MILVDTSVWVDHLQRGNADLAQRLGRYVVIVTPRTDGSGVHDVHAVGACGAEQAVVDVAAVQSGATVTVLAWTRAR